MSYKRKLARLALSLILLPLCLGASASQAASIAVSVSGEFTAGLTADSIAAPNQSWAISFDVNASPTTGNADALGFDAPFTNFTYSLNGALLAVAPQSIRFYTTGGGGQFTVFFGPETGFNNGQPIPEFSFSGGQVFSGTTTSPTMVAGVYPISDAVYSDALNYDDEGASGNVTLTGGPVTTTPEPSTFGLILAFITVAILFRFRRSAFQEARQGNYLGAKQLCNQVSSISRPLALTILSLLCFAPTAHAQAPAPNCTLWGGAPGEPNAGTVPCVLTVDDVNTITVQSEFGPEILTRTSPTPSPFTLSGQWSSDSFQCPTGTTHAETFTIAQAANLSYVATKVIGDQCVTSGHVSFFGVLTAVPGSGLGRSCKQRGQQSCGNPIDVGLGNKFEQITDYRTTGQNPLEFTRSYNSLATQGPPTFASMLGTNWRSNYDRYVRVVSSTEAFVERPDGQILDFVLTANGWQTTSDIDLRLSQVGEAWTLIDSDDTVETYQQVTFYTLQFNEAALVSIQARNGYFQALAYNGFGQIASVSDSYGRRLSFTYSNGLLQTVTTPDGLILTYGFAAVAGGGNQLTQVGYSTIPATSQTYLYENASLPFALTGIIDEDGNRYATWTYDASSRALSSQHAGGADFTSVAYDDLTGNRAVTNALGQQELHKFTLLQNIPKATETDRLATATTAAATELFTYDSNGYLASETDWNGNQTTYVNDVHGQPTTINDAVGTAQARTTTVTYEANFRLPQTIVTPGLTTTFVYDAHGEVLNKTLTDTTTTTVPYATGGQTRTWTNTWNNFLLASTKGPRTDVAELTKFTYDASGALTGTTNALGQITQITSHTGGGLPLIVLDANGVTHNFTYDVRQRLLTSAVVTASGTLTTSYVYDAAGNLIKTTLPDGSALTMTYDAAHRLTQITDLFHQNVNYTFDALGDRTNTNLTAVGNRIQRQHSDSFDALGRTLTDAGGMGQLTSYTYDPDGNALTITDPLSRLTHQTFDALNRLSTTTDPNGGITRVNYDSHDRPLSVTDPNGNTTNYIYDGFGGVIQQLSPDSGTTVYHYDPAGNLIRKIDGAGVTTNNTYDALDRILITTYPSDPSENVAYNYDQAGHGFGVGKLTSLTDAAGSLSRTYDERGNLLTDTRVNGATTLKTVYTYDAASRFASMTYPSGWKSSFTRDIMGRIWQIPLTTPSGAVAGNAITNATYEPFGPLYTLTFGNGVNESRHFDLDYRVTSLTDKGTSPLQNLTYIYDANDNVSSIADGVMPGHSQNFGYDVLNRLTAATGAYGTFGWTYDKLGNRLQETLGAAITTYNYTAGTNRLASITSGGIATLVSYTRTGNISAIPPTTGALTASLTYNAANRLNIVTGTALAITASLYDAFGQRFSKTSGGTATLFAYGQDGSLAEENQGGVATDYVYLNGLPVVALAANSSKVYFLHDDRLGTPQLATDKDQNVAWSAQYQPFGDTGHSVVGGITQNLRLPGQYFDAETGWNHNGWREYLPDSGRYLQSDLIDAAAGSNRYLYASANPGKFTDPHGLISTEHIWSIVRAAQNAFTNGPLNSFWDSAWEEAKVVFGTYQTAEAPLADSLSAAAWEGSTVGFLTGWQLWATGYLGHEVLGPLVYLELRSTANRLYPGGYEGMIDSLVNGRRSCASEDNQLGEDSAIGAILDKRWINWMLAQFGLDYRPNRISEPVPPPLSSQELQMYR